MKTIKKFLFASLLSIFGLINLSVFSLASAQNVYGDVLGNTTNSTSLKSAINWWDVVTTGKGSDLFNEQVTKIVGYIIDIFIVIWIIVAFIGGYKIMTSDKEETLKEWIRLVLFGVVWIIIMVSAEFLAKWLVWNNGIITDEFTNLSTDGSRANWVIFAKALYNNILYPFIKLVLYFVVWFLFFMMVGKIIWYVTSTDEAVRKKAWWVIIWCVVWILIVMWSKQLVEAVMWKQDAVLKDSATRINGGTWMWNGILNFEDIPLITQIINWVMWLTMLVILVLIIIQWYKMFTKPDDPKNRESLKKTLLYIIIWVLVIWAAYAISSVLIVNNVPIETASSTL